MLGTTWVELISFKEDISGTFFYRWEMNWCPSDVAMVELVNLNGMIVKSGG